MFDIEFYKLTNPDLAGLKDWRLKRHYTTVGWKEGRDPSALFNIQAYLDLNPDVAQAGIDPLKHYNKRGAGEERPVRLSLWGQSSEQLLTLEDLEMCAPYIDADLLRKTAPHLAALDDASIKAWYLTVGWQDGVRPSSDFSTRYYLSTYLDVASVGFCPLWHYVRFGRAEGRYGTPGAADVGRAMDVARHNQPGARPMREEPKPEPAPIQSLQSEPTSVPPKETAPQTAHADKKAEAANDKKLLADMDSVASEFDADWYRTSYPDVTGDDRDLLKHYMTIGWSEGRNPSGVFSTTYYLDHYADIEESGANPLLHYVLFGRNEGRRCSAGSAIRIGYSPDANLTPELPALSPVKLSGRKPVPPKTVKSGALNIHWVVPDFRAGSGGHMTIFRMVRYLEQFGHTCTIWIETAAFHDTPEEAWETIVKYFQCVEADVRFVSEDLYRSKGDVIIATGWSTAWVIKDLTGFAARMYFVQDHEPEFYPTGSQSNLARQTYDFDLGCICASPWLENLMSERYGRWAKGFYLAYEPEQYFVTERAQRPKNAPLKVAVYGRAHTDRRCVQLALAGLQILGQKRQDFEVHFFGQDYMPFTKAPFVAYNHGVLATDKLAELYNDCDIGICFSGTNYSLVPQEMMACGLPLVEFNTESTQVIFPKNTVTLAGPAPMEIADKLGALMDSPTKRAKQRKAALNWVSKFSWHDSAREVENAILGYLDHEGTKLTAPAVRKKKDILFDVVVPTWNGKKEFAPVLEALRGQRVAEHMQIHCIDSTSNDGTIEWLKDQKDVSLTVIDQKDFQHGRTRNFGASLGKAPFIGFITQDAMPATPDWAGDILKMMRAVPSAAGLFGRHIAYPDHPIFVQEEITNHFANMLQHPLVLSKDTDPAKWESGDVGWRQFLHFYSDNNSAMRRDVWNDIPYPEVNYGEDQVWARSIIEAGHSKIYAPSATVYHSHDYNPEQTYKRSKTEGAFFYEYFGYELGKGSDEKIAKQIEREQRNMEMWGRRRAISDAEIAMRKANIEEKYRGWRDGRAEAIAGGGVQA